MAKQVVTANVVTVADGTLLVFQIANSHTISVEASDGLGQTTLANFVINVLSAESTVYTVDSIVDENDGDISAGNLSLREAVGRANATMRVYMIQFGAFRMYSNR